MFRRARRPDPVIMEKLLRRLRRTTPFELEKWSDQIVTGITLNIREIQKGLTRGNTDQTLLAVKDTQQGALSLLAAMLVMEENLSSI